MEERIKDILTEFFADKDLHLIEIKIRGEKKNKITEIYVDSESGVDLEKLSGVSRSINEKLDEEGISDELLKIVVSSPGAENPFKYFWQLKQHIGRTFEINDGSEKMTGKLMQIDEETEELTFEISEKKKDVKIYKNRFSEIESIKVKLPF